VTQRHLYILIPEEKPAHERKDASLAIFSIPAAADYASLAGEHSGSAGCSRQDLMIRREGAFIIAIVASYFRDTGESHTISGSLQQRKPAGLLAREEITHQISALQSEDLFLPDARANLPVLHHLECLLRLRGGKGYKRGKLLGGRPLLGRPPSLMPRSRKDPMKQMEIEMRNEARRVTKAVSTSAWILHYKFECACMHACVRTCAYVCMHVYICVWM
jgi:hypothetical protein